MTFPPAMTPARRQPDASPAPSLADSRDPPASLTMQLTRGDRLAGPACWVLARVLLLPDLILLII